MSERKNVDNGNCKSDKCQQINRQQGDKKELQHAPTLRCNRRTAVLREEKIDPQETEETVERGLAGNRAVHQEALVTRDYCRCTETRREKMRLRRVAVPHRQAGLV